MRLPEQESHFVLKLKLFIPHALTAVCEQCHEV